MSEEQMKEIEEEGVHSTCMLGWMLVYLIVIVVLGAAVVYFNQNMY